MSGGAVQNDKNQMQGISQQQSQLAQLLSSQGQTLMDQRTALQKPMIDRLTAITSGNKDALTSATSAQTGQIAQAAQSSKENIYDQMPAGAGRDVALAQNTMNKNSSTASFLNDAYTKAFSGLAGMGTESGNVGLQTVGGGLNAFSGSANTTGQVMNADQQAKQSTMSLFGSLAGAGGMAASKSDRRLKKNIRTIDDTLEKIESFRGVHFDFIEGEGASDQIGVIAQEVGPVFPELVDVRGSDGMYVVNYGGLAAVAVQAVKELHQQVKALQERLSALEAR